MGSTLKWKKSEGRGVGDQTEELFREFKGRQELSISATCPHDLCVLVRLQVTVP